MIKPARASENKNERKDDEQERRRLQRKIYII